MGSLTSTQKEVLVGSLLGDGTLRKQGSRTNALLEVNHSYQYKQYVDWKHSIFKEFVITSPKSRNGNGNRVAYRFTTKSIPVFTEFYKKFYIDGKKAIPKDLKLSAGILAVWFMDDGSRNRKSFYLNTQQFREQDQFFLARKLVEDLGIESTLNRDRHYLRIRITNVGAIKMRKLIAPYILPCFAY